MVREAETVEDLHAALMPVIEVDATPDLVPQGAMVLQPSEERRRSGSHYTPRVVDRANRADDAEADFGADYREMAWKGSTARANTWT